MDGKVKYIFVGVGLIALFLFVMAQSPPSGSNLRYQIFMPQGEQTFYRPILLDSQSGKTWVMGTFHHSVTDTSGNVMDSIKYYIWDECWKGDELMKQLYPNLQKK